MVVVVKSKLARPHADPKPYVLCDPQATILMHPRTSVVAARASPARACLGAGPRWPAHHWLQTAPSSITSDEVGKFCFNIHMISRAHPLHVRPLRCDTNAATTSRVADPVPAGAY